jgi:hypothetical protein
MQFTSDTYRIFLNYRREDTAGHAGRLYDAINSRYPEWDVFMDIDTIEPGVDFAEVVANAVGSCDVLLALIGQRWLKSGEESGGPRLRDELDFVRLEIAAALDRRIRVIPVLLQGTRMPSVRDLPEDIGGLARRNAIELSDHRWRYDVDQLLNVLNRLSEPSSKQAPTDGPTEARVEDAQAADGAPASTEAAGVAAAIDSPGVSETSPRRSEGHGEGEHPQQPMGASRARRSKRFSIVAVAAAIVLVGVVAFVVIDLLTSQGSSETAPPLAPTGVHVSGITPGGATLSWSKDLSDTSGGRAVTTYRVAFSSPQMVSTTACSGTAPTCGISRLSPSSRYLACVRGVNDAGTGPPTCVSFVTSRS